MRCKRCGNEILHVPEHLAGLAEWLCQQCTLSVPSRQALRMDVETIQKRMAGRGRRKAA